MTRVLSRPMFRLGGSSDGVGITSGFRRTGFQDQGAWTAEEEAALAEAQESVLNPEKEKYGFSELLSDAYRTARGSETFDDWWKAGGDLALERTDTARAEKKAKPQKDYDILSGAKTRSGEYYKATRPLEIERLGEYYEKGQEIIKNLDVGMKWDDFKKSKDFDDWEYYMNQALRGDFPTRWEVDARVREQLEAINKSRGDDSTIIPGHYLYDQTVGQIIIDIYKPYLEKLKFPSWKAGEKGEGSWEYEDDIIKPPGTAMGGTPKDRRGYNQGLGPAMDQQTDLSMTENIQTPSGDMSMTENIDTNTMEAPAQTMPSDDPYVLLRARLPQEISDDVVRLIAYNPQAFADFADIETQDDVIAFNKKYGVELIVNTDEMSGAIA